MSRNFHRQSAFQAARHMTKLLYQHSDSTMLSRILKNSLAENDVIACKVCGVDRNLVKTLQAVF